jgi:hypothetical protein
MAAEDRSLQTVTPQQAAIIHERLLGACTPTAIRLLRIWRFPFSPLAARASYAFFPEAAQAALQAADAALDEPAVSLRFKTGILILADNQGRR